MSLRYMSRTCMRAIQQLGDQGARSAVASCGPIKPLRQASDNPAAANWERRPTFGERLGAVAEDALSARRRRREAAKAENVVNLVCWGPN